MKDRFAVIAIVGFVCLLSSSSTYTSYSSERGTAIHSIERPVNIEAYGNLPMSFEPNRGQFEPQFKFGSKQGAYAVLLKATGATFRFYDLKNSKTTDLRIE